MVWSSHSMKLKIRTFLSRAVEHDFCSIRLEISEKACFDIWYLFICFLFSIYVSEMFFLLLFLTFILCVDSQCGYKVRVTCRPSLWLASRPRAVLLLGLTLSTSTWWLTVTTMSAGWRLWTSTTTAPTGKTGMAGRRIRERFKIELVLKYSVSDFPFFR